MTPTEDANDHVRELKRDLQDGDDLAQALTFIGDVLHRRIRRVHRSLDVLEAGSPDVERLQRRVRETLSRYEDELQTGQRRLQAVIDEFQTSLDREAERLEERAEGPDED